MRLIWTSINKTFLLLLKHSAAVGFAFLIVWAYAQIALNLSFLSPISEAIENFSITDKYYQILKTKKSHAITIVDLKTLIKRDDIAKTLEEIERCNPAVIGVDCVFENESGDTIADNAIRDFARQYDNVVYSYRLSNEKDSNIGYADETHSFFAEEIPVHEGVTNMPRENLYNQIKRTLRSGWRVNGIDRLSFIGELMNMYAGFSFCKTSDTDININFSPTEFEVVSPADIESNRQILEGRIVLLGTMNDMSDTHYSPLGNIAGVELLAYGIQTLLEDSQVVTIPIAWSIVLAYLLVLLTNFLQLWYLDFTSNSTNPIVHHVMGSAYILGIVTFLWISVLMWVTFLLFCHYSVSVDLEWSIAAMAFLSTSRGFYTAMEEYYNMWINNKEKTI